MAQYKVDTVRLSQCADRIQNLQWDMERIAGRLANVNLYSVLQARVSPKLTGTILDCTTAVNNQAANLRKLSGNLEQVNELYKGYENKLKDPKDKTTATVAQWADGLDTLVDQFGKISVPFGIASTVWNFSQGNFKDTIDGLKALATTVSGTTKAIFNVSNGKIQTDWAARFLGINATETKNLKKMLESGIHEYFPGKDGTTASKVVAGAKWAGVALSFVGSGISNYNEFEGDMSNGRFWSETILEGALDVGKGLAVTAVVGAALGGAPAIAVAAAGVAVTWIADEVCEYFTGKSVTEALSDLVLDGAEKGFDNIADGIQRTGAAIADGAQALWSGICNAGEKLFAW